MKTTLLLTLAASTTLAALEIRIDYTYDTTGFFNTPEKRRAIETVAAFFGDMIQDELLRIDPADFPGGSWTANFQHPATGAEVSIPGLVVPENTIIIYVGGRDLGGSVAGRAGPGGYGLGYNGFGNYLLWFDRVIGRGSPAAAVDPNLRTDFALWGGSAAFDSDRTWNFSLDANLPGSDFVTVALHELGHVLGIGTAHSWFNRIASGKFTGSSVVRSLGAQAPVSGDAGHFANPQSGTLQSPAFGSFGTAHGLTRPSLMLASTTDFNVGGLNGFSDLDLAALVDCGWEITPRQALSASSLSPASVSFSWPSSTFFSYQVQRGESLLSFPVTSPITAGNGAIQTWSDPSPPTERAFYRLAAIPFPAPAAAPALTPARNATAAGNIHFHEEPSRVVEGCECPGH